MFDMSGNIISRLGSPGTEEQDAKKKMSSLSYVAKEAAEFLSKYSTEQLCFD